MVEKKTLTAVVVIVMVIALVNISLSLVKFTDLGMTGFATQTGVVNLTVMQVVTINMSRASIEWGDGTIDAGQLNATLITAHETASVTRGNWSSATYAPKAMILENIGNVNCSLTLQTGLDAHGLFGSLTSLNEEYKWNITEKDVAACSGGNLPLNEWWDVNQSTIGTACNQFNYVDGNNEVYIDVWLTIPYDSLNVSVNLQDTITATATTAI